MNVHTLSLRDYQREAVEAVFTEHQAGVMRQLVRMATGLGKTASAMKIIERFLADVNLLMAGRRVLWLTHRDELVQQTLKAFALWMPDHPRIGVVKAELNELDCEIVVASVQTLAVESRRDGLLASQLVHGGFGLVISDEHHLSPAPTWAATLEALGCGEPDGPLMVGLTATPNRHDGVGLKVTTDKIVFDRDIVWAVANGYLVPPKGITVKVDLSEVKIDRGDYQAGSLSDVLELDGAHIALARLIHEHAKDRRSIVFTPTVNFAHLVAEECNKVGLTAEVVWAETPLPERHAMYSRLRSGETRVIANCNVLQEGFDEPSVDCIVNARPTRSITAFTQRVGRGLRLYPGKDNCLVIALAGSERNKLATVASLAGRTWEDAMKAREAALGDEVEFDFANEFDEVVRREAERAKLKVRPVDLLGAVRKKITWAVIDQHSFARRVPKDVDENEPTIIVKEDWLQNGWRVVLATKAGKQAHYTRLLDGVDFATAQAFADDEIRRRIPASLLDPKARWRANPVTDPQLKALRSWGLSTAQVKTAGQASDLLEAAFLARTARAA